MTIACLSVEQCQQRVLDLFQEHVRLLDGWIGILSDKANEILRCETTITETEQRPSGTRRTARGLHSTASKFIATAMRLSKEKMNAAILLSRQDFTGEKAAARAANNPCAREAAKATETAPSTMPESASKPVNTASYGDSAQTAANPVCRENTPVRASEPTVEDVLREPLAPANELNDAIRRQRRQRAKELHRAKRR